MQEQPDYRLLYDSMLNAFSIVGLNYLVVEVVYDTDGKPVDFICRDTNQATQELMHKSKEWLVGKRRNDIFGALFDESPQKIGEIERTGKPAHFQVFSAELKKHYDIYAWRVANKEVALIVADITEHKKAEEELKRQFSIRQARNKILEQALSTQSEEALGEVCLSAIETITNSELGFISELTGSVMNFIAISQSSWKAFQSPLAGGHRKVPKNLRIVGLYGKVLKEGKSFYTNSPSVHPNASGLPPGHPVLHSFLGVPLKKDNTTIGLIAVANREGGYTSTELDSLEGLAPVVVAAFERKRAEEAIKENEESLTRSQEIAHLGSWELDIVNDKLTWSDEVYRIFGLKPQEFGATYEAFLSYVHPDDRSAVDCAYSGSVIEGKDSYEIDHKVIRKNTGEIRFVHEKCTHVTDESGKIIRSIGMVHDITEQKKAEAALKESEELFSQAFHSISFPVSLARVSDNRFVDVNDSFLQMIGYNREEVVGHTSKELKMFPNYSEREEFIRLLQKQGSIRNREIDIETKSCCIRRVLFSVELISINQQQHMLSSLIDITERRRLESEIQSYTKELEALVEQRTKELKDAERLATIGATAGMVGHDIRNPLQAITSDVFIAKTELASIADNEVKKNLMESLQEIESNTDYINKIVQDLQDLR